MLTKPTQMTTLTEVLEKLRLKKRDNEYKMSDKGFTVNEQKYYNPEDLTIIKTYRFEGESDPGDSSVLYLIEANDGQIGYSLDSYGVYSDHDENYNEFVRKIKIEDRDEQILFSEVT